MYYSDMLLAWIERLNQYCVALNDALIEFYSLESRPELADWNPFTRPGRAVRAGLTPRQGNFVFEGQPVSYRVHGGGITFGTPAFEHVSFEYFPQPPDYQGPILSIWSIQQFIGAVEPTSISITNSILDETLDKLFAAGKITRVQDGYSQFYLKQSE